MSTSALNSREDALIKEVDPENLMRSTAEIARWVRLSGTEEEAQAFDWIEGELERYGLATTRHHHPALVSWPESASLTVQIGDGAPQPIPCQTHAFATSTPPGGLAGELVYIGRGSEDDLATVDVRGRIVLVDGIIAPNRNLVVERAGVAGAIWIAGSRLHERALSPIWGTPTPETAHLLPKTPSVSITADEGARLKEAAQSGPVRVRLETHVYRAWRDIPLLTADLRPDTEQAEDPFVLFSGHVDSWYYGAMDNGTANATMLEVARILAGRRAELQRGLRLAFWSGHSHARYAGSAWYADTFWQELHDRCVVHINVDSVGAKEATVLSEGNNMAELRHVVSDAIEAIAGQRLSARRYGRAGDQSFWGHGIPAALMSLSEQPAENADPVLLALHHQISGGASVSGGLGWWWHTPDDTVDKIDPDFLARDARIYTLLLHRLCTTPMLPLDYRPVVDELRTNLGEIRKQAGEHLDLSPVAERLDALATGLVQLDQQIATIRAAEQPEAEAIGGINRCLMRLGRALIPVDYTASGPFDHDLAVPTRPLPGLQPAARLATLEPDSDEYQFLRTRLVRERNRVLHGVIEADRAVVETLAQLASDAASAGHA